ncbi:hypothetical protein HAX54_036049 [Datura stramonium]|uniref:Uncharacterized protein n=1 Tax=Datura stramonium TaxID=4076 RepID=A0ABS8SFW0_DATST|nr:hypothetical protein [Datura stramonium]
MAKDAVAATLFAFVLPSYSKVGDCAFVMEEGRRKKEEEEKAIWVGVVGFANGSRRGRWKAILGRGCGSSANGKQNENGEDDLGGRRRIQVASKKNVLRRNKQKNEEE